MAGSPELEALRKELAASNPVRGSLLLLLILVLMAAVGYWASVTEIDDVTRADGKIVPLSQTQVIQSSEPGILAKLHVSKGETVRAGQLLMEFDRTLLDSQLNEGQQRSKILKLRIQRLTAEVNATAFEPDQDLTAAAPEVWQSELALFFARQSAFDADLAVLERQVEQVRRGLEAEQSKVAMAEQTLKLVARELEIMSPLIEQRLEPETTFLALERTRSEWTGRRASAIAAVARGRASLAEIDERRIALGKKRISAAQEELAKTVAQLVELRPRIAALSARASRAEVRSPVNGVVNQILLTTVGGVAQSGQSLMEIVPLDDGLLVEKYVQPSDIAFLYPGQKVRVKLTAYDFSRYGGLEGTIMRIGANVITRQETQQQVFVVEVRTEGNLLDADGVALEIIPGMVAQVDILSKKKKVVDYIMRPIIRVKSRAFRD